MLVFVGVSFNRTSRTSFTQHLQLDRVGKVLLQASPARKESVLGGLYWYSRKPTDDDRVLAGVVILLIGGIAQTRYCHFHLGEEITREMSVE